MRITNYHAVTLNRSCSATTKKYHIPFPDLTGKTKTAPAMSEEKYQEAIVEQARQDQVAGRFQSGAGFKSLENSYVSVVSPDRKKIITEGLTAIDRNNQPCPRTITLLDILCGTVRYKEEDDHVVNNPPYIEYYDSNGEMVATYSNTGWHLFGTKAEAARGFAFRSMYNAAWGNAERASQGENDTVSTTAAGSVDSSV